MAFKLGNGFTPRFGRVTEQLPILIEKGETPISENFEKITF